MTTITIYVDAETYAYLLAEAQQQHIPGLELEVASVIRGLVGYYLKKGIREDRLAREREEASLRERVYQPDITGA